MACPFPGMAPYLERPSMWVEFHTVFLVGLYETLIPRVGPKYIVRLQTGTTIEPFEGAEHVTIGPDVSVRTTRLDDAAEPSETPSGRVVTPVLVPLALPVPASRQRWLELYEHQSERLVTVIEMLSPSNKRPGPDREAYLLKRRSVLECEVHLVEIDLLRAGRRMPAARPLACSRLSVFRLPGRR